VKYGLYCYIITFRGMCTVPNMAVFCILLLLLVVVVVVVVVVIVVVVVCCR